MTRQAFQLPLDAERFLESLAAKQRKESTITRYRYDLADFFRYLEIKTESEIIQSKSITPHMAEEYFYILENERRYQLRTLKRIQTVLKRYFAYLLSTGKIQIDPMASLDLDESIWNKLTKEELLTRLEEKKLTGSLLSDSGLSQKQAAARPLLAPRNLFIVTLFLYYGLRLQEISNLKIKYINQGKGQIMIPEETGNPRTLRLTKSDQKLLFHYINVIPEPVRPKRPQDPLLVAFDFQRQTYRWSYETDAPKNLTEIAIQKMIREERKRAGIDRSVSARHFRNTFIIRALQQGQTPEQVKNMLGLQTILTLNKYIDYVEKEHSP
ncbi:site-specific integrase [Alteribacillus sp. YIM 98480]|uniref:tyrosine-type recombinase/integrase n=1 Tax=Alteribacillus sp. YIM 98480 TaxID=2606599 RepID=UPI00131CDC80|nr:site-specific integrase [Alteribacillus sp. YIM 98480]